MENQIKISKISGKYKGSMSPNISIEKTSKNLDSHTKKPFNLSINTSNMLAKEIQSADLNVSKNDRNSWLLKDGKLIKYVTVLDKISDMKLCTVYNNWVIKDLEGWTNLLLNLINQSRMVNSTSGEIHQDNATPINNLLDKISKLELENLNLQLKLITQNKKSKAAEKQAYVTSSILEIVESDLKEANLEVIKRENQAMLESVISITEELDVLSASNADYKSKMNSDDSLILKLMTEKDELRQEQKALNNIIISPAIIPIDTQFIEVRNKILIFSDLDEKFILKEINDGTEIEFF